MIYMELFKLSVNSEKITVFWKNKINQNSMKCKHSRQNVAQNCYIKILCQDKKGSRIIYDILIGNKDLTPPPRNWVNTIGNIIENGWNSYTNMIKNIKEVKLPEFQYLKSIIIYLLQNTFFSNLKRKTMLGVLLYSRIWNNNTRPLSLQ